MRVIDVNGLGWGAVAIDIEGDEILLVEASLTADERLDALSHALSFV